jgi:hypothetical protein
VERAALTKDVGERAALDQFHDDERGPVGFEVVENIQNAGVLETR